MKNKTLIITALLVLALQVRLQGITQSLWLDEAIQANVALLKFPEIFTNYLPGDFHPPFSYILTWLVTRFLPPTEFALRLPSLLAGVGMVWLAWRFMLSQVPRSNKLLNLKFPAIAGLLIVSAPLLIYYSQEGRMYIIAAFFAMWSMISFWELHTSKHIIRSKSYLEYFLVTGAMMLSHYMTWFLLPILAAFYLLKHKPKKTIQFFSPLGFWMAAITPLLLIQIKVGSAVSDALPIWQSLSQFSLKQLALIPTKILVGRIPIDFNLQTALLIAVPLAVWSYVVIKARPKFKATEVYYYLAAWITIPVLIGIGLSTKLAVFSYFRFLYIAPAFYLLLVVSLIKLSQEKHVDQKLIHSVIYLFIVINSITSGLYIFNPANHREDWRSVVNYINDANRSPYVVIIKTVDRPFWYYDQNDHKLIDYQEVQHITDQPGFWLIKYAQPIFDPNNSTEQELLEQDGYTVAEEKHFRGDIVVKYLIKNQYLQANVS